MDKTNSENNSQPTKSSQVDTREEHVKELEDELLKLRIENAFLKELRRLRLEDEACLWYARKYADRKYN